MSNRSRYGWGLLLVQLAFAFCCFGQDKLTVHDIVITGNKKTHSYIILREFSFHPGESFSSNELLHRLKEAETQLINTALFHSVSLSTRDVDSTAVDILVTLKERWYIFPMPYFKPVDRNINQWLVQQNGDLTRLNYGIKLFYNNVTGVYDKLRVNLITGYTRQLSFSYNLPYFDRRLHWGITSGFATGKAREVNYNTIDDKQVFLKDTRYVRNFANANLGVTYRRALYGRHGFGITFSSEHVTDTIIKLNPKYFRYGRTSLGFPTLYYSFDYRRLDYNPYPTKGYAARIAFSKSGMNKSINVWQLHLKGAGFFPLTSKTFLQTSVYGGLKLPFKQPWFAQRFLGYGDVYMQGYEYYVVDGAAGGFLKADLGHQLFSRSFRSPRFKRWLTGERIPLRIYGNIFGNAGYVYNPQQGDNSLSNRMLFSGGFGIDFLTIYDIVFKIEWSFNQLGQNGLFLHPKSIF